MEIYAIERKNRILSQLQQRGRVEVSRLVPVPCRGLFGAYLVARRDDRQLARECDVLHVRVPLFRVPCAARVATVASAACTESICSERAGRRGEAVG